MKLTINREELNSAVSIARTAVLNRSINPTLECLHLKADEKGLSVRGTNLTEFVCASCKIASVDTPGVAVVKSDVFSKAVSMLEENVVTMEMKGTELVLTCGEDTTTFPTLVANSLLDEVSMDVTGTINIDAQVFIDAVKKTAPFAGIGSEGWQTTCINLRADGDLICLSGTDCRKSSSLSCAVISIEGQKPLQVNLPEAIVPILFRLEPDDGDVMTIALSESRVKFTCGEVEISSSLLAYTYPPVQAVLDDSMKAPTKAKADRRELLNRVKQVAIFTDDGHPAVRMTFEGNRLTLDTPNSIVGRGSRAMECQIDGPNFIVMLNAKNLITALEACDADEITLYIKDRSVAIASEPNHHCAMGTINPN